MTFLASVDIVSSPGLTDLPPLAFGQVGIDAVRFYGTGLIYLEKIVFSPETASQLKSLYIKHNSEFMSLANDVVSFFIQIFSIDILYSSEQYLIFNFTL